jgi:cyclophilin family peptidyl-prolyl cis-trans isomerase
MKPLFLGVFLLLCGIVNGQTTVPTIGRVIPPQTLAPNGPALTLNLANHFAVPGVSGPVVLFDTIAGKFAVELRPDAAPQHVANFLSYIRNGQYTNTFFHRSASLDATGAISIVQAGGFVVNGSSVAAISTAAPVPLEYNLPNERGTLAAARTSDVNSATSQWYFNVRDNTTVLGRDNGGGYTVFGRVLGSGMTVVDAIAALPRVNAGSPFSELPVRNYTSGDVAIANLAVVNSITPVALFPDTISSGVLAFSVQSSDPGVVNASISGSTLTLAPGGGGSATVTLTATDVNGNTVTAAIPITVAAVGPSFVSQPGSQTVAAGSTVVLSAVVNGAWSYQWQRNGTDLAGATDATLVIGNASSSDAGSYLLVARNSSGSIASNAVNVNVTGAAPVDVGRLANVSIRSNAGVGDQTLIVGFSLGGAGTTGSTPLLLRAAGPALVQYGVPGTLADPMLTLYTGTTPISSNNNWGSDPVIDARSRGVGAFAFAPGSLDAALAISPNTGSYTMQVAGANGGTGTALAEIYEALSDADFTPASPRLVNVSARTQVGTDAGVLIAGFVIRGSTAKTVLIRASGPALVPFGVGGTLENPTLQVTPLGTTTPVAQNDDWGGDPQIAATANAVGAFPWTNGASKDAAVLVTLPPGRYTAQVSGVGASTGVALVEVYEVQ